MYLPKKADFHKRIKYDFPVVAISLSDYNAIRKMLGYEQISLGDNEFITQWKTIATEEERNRFIAEHTSVATDGGTLNISEQSYSREAMGQTLYNSYTDVLYVFPDKICEELLPVMRNRYITTTKTSLTKTQGSWKGFLQQNTRSRQKAVPYMVCVSARFKQIAQSQITLFCKQA